ncbi:MAG TPA: hypothetical protein VFT29_18130 [Gemmatimonadaceae bacterium]|nr:hypothetical protein [Gemmatimonadaceae bacterium]
MSRPAGTTVSAVVALLGSVFTLLFAALMLTTAFMPRPQTTPPGFANIALGSAAFLAVLAALGLWTSVGLFRLRPWARTSILVFAGVMAVTSLLSLIFVLLMPMPPGTDPAVARFVRPMTLTMFGVPFLIGVWWLIQFNTRTTREAFAAGVVASVPARPMSVTIIAWANIVGGISSLFPIIARLPAFLAGLTLTGWAAGVLYAFFGAIGIYIGRGLLELRERARLLAIGWFVVSLIHMAVVTFVPVVRGRMLEMQKSIAGPQAQASPFDTAVFTKVMFGFVAVLAVTAIWFLIRNRAAFKTESNYP